VLQLSRQQQRPHGVFASASQTAVLQHQQHLRGTAVHIAAVAVAPLLLQLLFSRQSCKQLQQQVLVTAGLRMAMQQCSSSTT
jgi:ABC-type uncharacterized transport system permease subunit